MERACNRKLKAFTLLELIVVLTISTLVIALGYSSYKLIYQFYTSQLLDYEQYEEWSSFVFQFQHDFVLSESAKLVDETFKLNKGEDSLVYIWDAEQIVRMMPNRQDTFFFTLKPTYHFLDSSQLINGLVKRVDFEFGQSLSFEKEYGAAIRINQKY